MINIQPGDTLYTSLVKCNKNGDVRHLKVFMVAQDPYTSSHRVSTAFRIIDITRDVASALGLKMKDDALVVRGGGMDMGYHVVYSYSRHLFPEGFTCIEQGCPSNDHVNGDRDYTPHTHKDGGYALLHRWL